LDLLGNVTNTVEPVGTFLWPGSTPEASVSFRYFAADDDRRSLDEIAMPELIGLVRENPELAKCEDPAVALGRQIGLARLAQAARARLEEAIRLALNNESQ
jgi:hypothetical protein